MNSSTNTPALKKRLFWEYDYDHIDWQREAAGIIERVIERGTHEEWAELVRFYGRERVLNGLKSEIKFLPEEIIADVCGYFNLKSQDLLCSTKKQLPTRHWI